MLFSASGLHHAIRRLGRHPGFTAAAVLTLALGIGATTAIFSVVYGVLLKPLPYPDADRLVSVRHTAPGLTSGMVGIADSMSVTYHQENRVFEQLGLWGEIGALALTGFGEPEQIRGVLVSDGTLQALGVPPVLGRWFTADEYAVNGPVALTAVDPGFKNPATVQIARIWIPPALISDAERWTRVYREVLEKIAALPGVSAAGFGGGVPGGGGTLGGPTMGPALSVEDRPDVGELQVSVGGVSPGYFAALGTRLVAGREPTWADVDQGAQVAAVSENLARAVWGEPRAALGKRIRSDASGAWREIVGVTQDVYGSVYQPPPPSVYAPIEPVRNGLRTTTYVIRSDRAGTESLANEIRQAVWASNPELTVYEVRTLQDLYRDSLARTSFMLVLLAISGVMALFLSVVGIYGVISYIVSQRTREIGIRLALGAQAHAVKRMFVRYALAVGAIGVAAGLAGAAALSRWMTSLLFEVRPLDPATYVAVLGVLLGAVTLAAYLPARRASRLDPAETLRTE